MKQPENNFSQSCSLQRLSCSAGDVRQPFNAAEPPGTPWARVNTRKPPMSWSRAATTWVAGGAASNLRQIVESGVDVKRLWRMIFLKDNGKVQCSSVGMAIPLSWPRYS